jgi:hypothetical protein
VQYRRVYTSSEETIEVMRACSAGAQMSTLIETVDRRGRKEEERRAGIAGAESCSFMRCAALDENGVHLLRQCVCVCQRVEYMLIDSLRWCSLSRRRRAVRGRAGVHDRCQSMRTLRLCLLGRWRLLRGDLLRHRRRLHAKTERRSASIHILERALTSARSSHAHLNLS